MTERELLIAIASYDATRLAEAFAPLTEAERKELQPGLMRFLNGGGAHHLNDETVWLKPYATQLDDHFNDWIARLALGKLSDLSGIVISRIAPSCLENMVKVLADRRPDWAQAWLDKLLPAGGVDWVAMQELIA